MPFKRRRRRGRKSKYVTKRGLPFQLMKFAETKYVTFANSNVTIRNPPTLSVENIQINNISEGTGENERVGQAIQLSGIHIKIIFEAVNGNSLRFIRVGVWTPRVVTNTTPPFVDMVNQPNYENFTMWFDQVVSVPLAAAATPGGVMTIRKKFKPYMKCLYDVGLGGSVTKNAIRFVLLPEADASVIASWSARVYYKDI